MSTHWLADRFLDGFETPVLTSTDRWANLYRRLPQHNPIPGQWSTAFTEYVREWHYVMSPESPARQVTICGPAQAAKSSGALNLIGHRCDHLPTGILILVPDADTTLLKWRRTKLEPLFQECPTLERKRGRTVVGSGKKGKGSDNRVLIEVPGGFVTLQGSNTVIQADTTSIVIIDDADRCTGMEGDLILMAEGRTKTFSSGKVIVLSSPSFLETSLIWREYEKGTQKKYHVPCLHCNELQVLQLAHLYYDRENKRVCYTCAACGVLIDEAEKAEMIRRGKWVAARPQMTGIHESYQYSGLVSPFETWAKVFRMYLEAARQAKKGDFKALQAFKNLTMGEPFKKPVGRILQGLERRIQEKRESYNLASLPKGVNTCFVDVQANRLESSVYHYAPDDTAWLLEHKVLKGDTMLAGVWEDLFEYMKATPIHGMGLDAGYQATHVINKVRELLGKVRQHRIRWIWPLHGKGTPFGQPAKDLWSRRVEPGRLVVTNVDSGKDLIMARAAMDITLPGALHFPTWLSKAQVQQLCAERPVTIEDQITKSQWVKRKGYDRNEMLDCAVGCLAIWQGLQLLIPGLRQRLRSTKSKRAQPAMRKQTWL